SADAERVELVKNHVDDGGLSPLGRFHHGRLHGVQTVDGLCVAVEQLEQQVTPQCLHSFPPPRFLRQNFLLAGFFCTVGPFFFHCKKKIAFWPAPPRSRALAAGSPSGAEVNFLLAFVGRAATMSEKFTTGGGGAPLVRRRGGFRAQRPEEGGENALRTRDQGRRHRRHRRRLHPAQRLRQRPAGGGHRQHQPDQG